MMAHPMHLHGMWMMLDNDQGSFDPIKHVVSGHRIDGVRKPVKRRIRVNGLSIVICLWRIAVCSGKLLSMISR